MTFIFLSLAYGSSNDSSSSSSSSPYSNVNAALKECGDKLKRDTAAGYYYHLSDVQMYKRMEKDQENCMAGYGHYPK